MAKKKPTTEKSSAIVKKDTAVDTRTIDETALFERVIGIIENRKGRAGAFANREITLMYWEVGLYINSVLLGGERAEYGKKIVATLSRQLVEIYGNSFELTKLRRMLQFAEIFPDAEIVATLSRQCVQRPLPA